MSATDPDPNERCISCPEGMPRNECPESKRPCGHHCNHSWVQDVCHWCGREFGEDLSHVGGRGWQE